jgi:hypothetical protein
VIPSVITTHVAEGKKLLTSMFRDRKVVAGLLAAYLKQAQLLEDAIWQVIDGRTLEDAIGNQLTIIGALVGEKRKGRSDTDYREAIRLRILINRSTGKVSELIYIIFVAARGAEWKYWEGYPAGFTVLFGGTTAGFAALKDAVLEAKPAGVGKGLMFTSGTLANLFKPCDSNTGLGGNGPAHSDGTAGYPVAHIE